MSATGDLTKRQKQVLRAIYQSLLDSGYPPTLADLRDELDVSSNQAVLDLLKLLEEKGFIKKEEGTARGLKITQKGYDALNVSPYAPMVGTTAAGPFTETLEQYGEWKTLSNQLARAEKIGLFKVSGDSMVNAGINSGDIVVVKEDSEFKNGDIVLARNEEGTTIKRFVSTKSKTYLAPENPKYKNIPIYPETRLLGKVVGILGKTRIDK